MANLKEIRGRINSVSTTLKITSAMSLIASAKLHAAQNAVGNMVPYEQSLRAILERLLRSGASLSSADVLCAGASGDDSAEQEAPSKQAILVVSSNQNLCGGFNANIMRAFSALGLDKENTVVYAAGKYGMQHISKEGYEVVDMCQMSGKPSYPQTSEFAEKLCQDYMEGRITKVLLLYTHFVSASSQKVVFEQYLPFEVSGNDDIVSEEDYASDIIMEPGVDAMLQMLVPKLVRLRMHTVMLDAATAEHAARTMAMQTATDNAKELLSELNLTYNKLRQQAITAEILDLLGGQTNI